MRIINKGYPSSRYCSYIVNNSTLSEVAKRNSYILRLCALVSLYLGVDVNIKGNVLMLTFTYNNENLPFWINPNTGERVPVFNREHVKTFLNRLKTRFSRESKGHYKYFFCFEYGKNTKRQHMHALFCLSPEVSVKWFVDTCRELWQYGFMFPSPHGNPYEAAKLRHAGKGASYAAKYVCKDVSYYDIPAVQRYIEYMEKQSDEDKKILRNGLPRIYQSNGIGENLLTQLDDNFFDVCENGLINPLTNKRAPIPYYVYNKYFFQTIPAFDSRKGKNDKPLYDRVLKREDNSYIEYKLTMLHKQVHRTSIFFDNENLNLSSLSDYSDILAIYVNKMRQITGINDNYTLSYIFTIYKNYVRCASDKLLYCVDTFTDLFTIDFVKEFLNHSTNTYQNYLDGCRYNKYIPLINCFEYNDTCHELFKVLNSLCNIYDKFSDDIQEIKENDFQKAESIREMLRNYKFPTDLC